MSATKTVKPRNTEKQLLSRKLIAFKDYISFFFQERNLFFDDGKRKIDCVLAWKVVSSSDHAEKQEKFKRWRENFFRQLSEEGLELELDERVGGKVT